MNSTTGIYSPRVKLQPLLIDTKCTEFPLEFADNMDLESLSPASQISDVMQDCYIGTIFEAKEAVKHMGQTKINKLIMNSFSDDFKKVLNETRKMMNIKDQLFLESPSEILLKSTLKPKTDIHEKYIKRRIDTLNDTEDISNHCDKSLKTETESDALTYDNMTGIWRLIYEKSNESPNFHVTPKEFNIYEEPELYWLKAPDVSWKDIEFSKEKCRRWLLNQCDSI